MYSYGHRRYFGNYCNIHRNNGRYSVSRGNMGGRCHTITPLQYFIPRMYYFFARFVFRYFFQVLLHRVVHFTLRTLYSLGICLPVTVFNVPDVDTAATGKGTDIYYYLTPCVPIYIHRIIDAQNTSSSGFVLRRK